MDNGSSSSSSRGPSDPGRDNVAPNCDMDNHCHGAAVSSNGSSGSGGSSSAATRLAMHFNSYYDVTQFVTDWDAHHTFGLPLAELRPLKYEARYIPGISRQGMRLKVNTALYNRSNIEGIAEKRRKAKEAKQQASREMAEARRKRYQQAAQAAKQTVKTFSSCKRGRSKAKHGDVELPDTVLQRIVGCLAAFEPDGVRGPSMAANDLANAALVCWDFYNACKLGFVQLQQQVEALQYQTERYWPRSRSGVEEGLKRLPAADGLSWQQWGAFLSDPLRYNTQDLYDMAGQLGVPKSGKKAELLLKVLRAFGLSAPSKAPPQLLRAVVLERCCILPWQGGEALVEFRSSLLYIMKADSEPWGPGITHSQLVAAESAAAWRKLLLSVGVDSKAQLLRLAASAAAAKEKMQQEQRERERQLSSIYAAEREARRREVIAALEVAVAAERAATAAAAAAADAPWDAVLQAAARKASRAAAAALRAVPQY